MKGTNAVPGSPMKIEHDRVAPMNNIIIRKVCPGSPEKEKILSLLVLDTLQSLQEIALLMKNM